jgi:Arc/MetJ-type ribon-helix-helix transcriptional regulator
MTETITARLPEELVQRVDAAVKRGMFTSRSDALREIVEDHLREHPELFLDIKLEELLGRELSDEELRRLGARLFKGVDVARLVSEGRGR